jgi:hypothetical protein
MTLISLQALTWSTVTGAVVGALLLASSESGIPEWSHSWRAAPANRTPLLTEPTRATTPRAGAAQRPAITPVSETIPREIEPR